jgi:hypothetical protein
MSVMALSGGMARENRNACRSRMILGNFCNSALHTSNEIGVCNLQRMIEQQGT